MDMRYRNVPKPVGCIAEAVKKKDRPLSSYCPRIVMALVPSSSFALRGHNLKCLWSSC